MFNPLIIRSAILFWLGFVLAGILPAQDETPAPIAAPSNTPIRAPTPITTTTLHKRGWIGRALHPFSSSEVLPKYNDRKLRGLVLELQISPQPVRLSEVRQLEAKLTVTNLGKHMITLDFPTDQRIEIRLLNAADEVLTKWSDNHAINKKPSTVLVNPDEHVDYKETIATRDLTPGKVFTAEVFFPQYPELLIRQKFLTEQ